MLLEEFVKEEIKKPFVWGETDCCATIDRWSGQNLLKNYGREPRSEKEARDWLIEKGGIVRAVDKVMKKNKVPVTKEPVTGDVGLIQIFGNKICMAIKTKNFWFSRDETGNIFAPLDVTIIKAWKICHN